jgi:excisionase family DNA binding protein
VPNANTPPDRLLTPAEVGRMFRVDPKTVTRWAAAERISSIRTPGGHRRFREAEVRAILAGQPTPTTTEPTAVRTVIVQKISPVLRRWFHLAADLEWAVVVRTNGTPTDVPYTSRTHDTVLDEMARDHATEIGAELRETAGSDQ